MGTTNGYRRPSAAELYWRAADALQPLDWTIGYIPGVRRWEISKALARNRADIRLNLIGEHDGALPSERTPEERRRWLTCS
jgi:hypothetical protein